MLYARWNPGTPPRHFPVIPHLSESGPHERGRRHGEAAGKQIRVSLDLYAKLFNVYAALSWEDAKKKASRFEDSIAKYLPDVLEEMQGIAEGCGRRIF